MWAALLAGAALAASPQTDPEPTGERRGWTLLPLPTLDAAPEIGFSAGAVALFSARPFEDARPLVVEAEAAFTTRGQIIVETDLQLFTPGDRGLVEAEVDWLRYPEDEWGLGNASAASSAERFSAERVEARVEVLGRPVGALFLGPLWQLQGVQAIEAAPGSRLARGALPGADGGVSSGAGLAARWDDRSRPLTPAAGERYARVAQVSFVPALGSAYTFGRLELDARRYLRLGPGVLALQARALLHWGDPPFRAMALLGGDNTLRGIVLGRYRDRHLAIARLEARLPVWWRLGVVGFAGLGDVFGPNSDARLTRLKPVAGGGLRVLLDDDEGTNLRLDLAAGPEALGLYVGFGEAF